MTMTPVEFSFATPKDLGSGAYRRFCKDVGLFPAADGYGFLHCTDENGAHWTRVTTDVEYLRLLVSAPQTVLADLDIPADKFPRSREGWPDEWQ